MSLTIATGVNLLFAGLLSGAEVAVRFGVKGALEALEDVAHLQARQALIRRLRYLVPGLYFPALIAGVAALLLRGRGPGLAPALAGLAALLIWIGVTLAGTVPLNQAALQWSPRQPPPKWRAQVARWEWLALIRVVVATVAFAAFLIAAR